MSSEGAAAAGQAPNTAARNASLDTFMTVSFMLPALFERHPFPVFGAGVNGARTDDFTVDSLLDDMRRPTRGARDDENRGEHRGRHAHPVIGHHYTSPDWRTSSFPATSPARASPRCRR